MRCKNAFVKGRLLTQQEADAHFPQMHKYKIHKYNAIWNSSSEDKNDGAVGSGFKTWMWGETNVKGLLNHIFTQCLAKIWKYLEIVSLLIFYDISMNEVTVQHVEFYIVMNFMLFSQLYWQLGWVLYFLLWLFWNEGIEFTLVYFGIVQHLIMYLTNSFSPGQ